MILPEPSVGVKLKGRPVQTPNDCGVKNGVGFTVTFKLNGLPLHKVVPEPDEG